MAQRIVPSAANVVQNPADSLRWRDLCAKDSAQPGSQRWRDVIACRLPTQNSLPCIFNVNDS
jgi:hypothetical protein